MKIGVIAEFASRSWGFRISIESVQITLHCLAQYGYFQYLHISLNIDDNRIQMQKKNQLINYFFIEATVQITYIKNHKNVCPNRKYAWAMLSYIGIPSY